MGWHYPYREREITTLHWVQNKTLYMHITGIIPTGKPWYGAERYFAYVLSSKHTWENLLGRLGARLQTPYYLSRVNPDKKIRSRNQRIDIGEYYIVNNTIQLWNHLPAEALGKLWKRVRKMLNQVKIGGNHQEMQ
jgi:hypothetical protein